MHCLAYHNMSASKSKNVSNTERQREHSRGGWLMGTWTTCVIAGARHVYWGVWIIEQNLHILKLLMTLLAFAAVVSSAIFILPVMTFMYLGMSIWRFCVFWYVRITIEGITEYANCTTHSTWESSNPLVNATLIRLEGELDATTICIKLQRILFDESETKEHYANWKRCLVKLHGEYFWKEYQQFNIWDHIIQAPPVFHQTSVSKKNIQEYISTLCHHTPVQRNLPPWQVIIVNGVGDNLEETTWVVIRAHRLLTTLTILPGMLIKAYLDPWVSIRNKSVPILSAPTGLKRFLRLTVEMICPTLARFVSDVRRVAILILLDIDDYIKTIAPKFHEKIRAEIHYVHLERKIVLNIFMTLHLIFRAPLIIFRAIIEIRSLGEKCSRKSVLLNLSQVIYRTLIWLCSKLIFHTCHILIKFWSTFCEFVSWTRKIWSYRTPSEQLTIDAILEFYWIVRAAISLPRLLLEELIETQRSKPLQIWKGYRRPESRRIAWSEGIPLKLFHAVQSSTGDNLSAVLLTVATGAVRNLLRSSNISLTPIMRCTVPVGSSNSESHSCLPSLMPLSLPTGCTSASNSLASVRKSLQQIRGYPEKYLVSTWLFKNISLLLPRSTLNTLTKRLTGNYPVLFTYITAPSKPSTLWDHKLAELYYFRQPLHQSVMSVCVTSYNGKVGVGAIGADWAAPHTPRITRDFEGCLMELAISAGVRMDRRVQRPPHTVSVSYNEPFRRPFISTSKLDSPNSSPSPTITNNIKNENKFFNELDMKLNKLSHTNIYQYSANPENFFCNEKIVIANSDTYFENNFIPCRNTNYDEYLPSSSDESCDAYRDINIREKLKIFNFFNNEETIGHRFMANTFPEQVTTSPNTDTRLINRKYYKSIPRTIINQSDSNSRLDLLDATQNNKSDESLLLSGDKFKNAPLYASKVFNFIKMQENITYMQTTLPTIS